MTESLNKESMLEKITKAAVKKMTPAQKKKKKKELLVQLAELREKLEEAKNLDPFWYVQPYSGEVTPDMKSFLLEYLNEEDVPATLDGQLDAILSMADIIGVSGGNQSGKSFTGALRGYIKSTGEIPEALEPYRDHPAIKRDIDRAKARQAKGGTMKGRMVGVDAKQLNNTVLPAWKMLVPREYLLNGKWKDSFSALNKILTLYKDGVECATIEFMTNSQDPESFQGPPLDWLGYDEEPREDIHQENLMRFTTAERIDIGFYWTPTNGISWATELFDFDGEEDNTGEKNLFKLCSAQNPKANKDTLRGILSGVTNYKELKMRLLGEAVSLSGLVYGKLFNKHVHVIEPFFEELDPGKKQEYLCIGGLDPHMVTASAGVFLLVDRENNAYVDFCYFKEKDTQEIKDDFAKIRKERGYRMGWSVADKSSNSSIIAFGGRNIYMELSRGDNAIPALRTSEKFEGSIRAGVDIIKQRLKESDGKKPTLYIVNRPENKELIKSFRTLQRDTYANESDKGKKDKIKEGHHHLHAALRYIFQYPVNWYGSVDFVPELNLDEMGPC